jgi:hypothetical protein
MTRNKYGGMLIVNPILPLMVTYAFSLPPFPIYLTAISPSPHQLRMSPTGHHLQPCSMLTLEIRPPKTSCSPCQQQAVAIRHIRGPRRLDRHSLQVPRTLNPRTLNLSLFFVYSTIAMFLTAAVVRFKPTSPFEIP